ncbi:LON peptidase substrate-binding domain-containing protein [Gordonia sinesedis]
MPMFPLGTALLPGEELPLRIFEPRYRKMVDDLLEHRRAAAFGVVLISRGSEVGGGETRTDVGTMAAINSLSRDHSGRALVSCTGTFRFQVLGWLADDPYPRALVETLEAPEMLPADRDRLIELGARIRALIDELYAARGAKPPRATPRFDASDLKSVGVFGWANRLPIGPADKHSLLSAPDTAGRVDVLTDAVDGLQARIRFGG